MKAVADFVAEEGHSINTHNRVYKNGAALSHAEKITIGIEYVNAKAKVKDGGEPNIVALSRSCKVSESTIRKIRDELRDHGRVLSPEGFDT